MRNALQKLGLACLPVAFACSVCATNPPVPAKLADTNFLDPEITAENPQVKELTETLKKEGIKTDSLLDEHFLFASLFWGAVASGYLVYSWRQKSIAPFLGGVAMTAASILVVSWFWMSVACVAVIFGTHWLMRQLD